jgi:hypothetical protein
MHLSFMVLEIDVDAGYREGFIKAHRDAVVSEDAIVLWGVAGSGISVCALVDPSSYFSYFYFPAPETIDGKAFTAEVVSHFILLCKACDVQRVFSALWRVWPRIDQVSVKR